jgi:hypothetical protein
VRGDRRLRMIRVGKVLVVCALAGAAVTAIASGRPGWRNYWGGFVYAPIALAVAVLLVAVALKRRGDASPRKRGRIL